MSGPHKSFAIMGTGGVGGYFGARLAHKGYDVAFIARGAHLEAIRGGGLKIESGCGDFHVFPARATDRPSEIGPVDFVFFAVKLWDTEAAAEAVRPLLGPATAVISFQNGVEAADVLSAALGGEHVMGGVAQIAAVIAAPGVIRHTGTMANLFFGELDGQRSSRAEALLAACADAGIDAVIAEDIIGAIWRKFVFLAAMSGLTSLTRRTIGPIRDDPDTRDLLVRAMQEVVAVAGAKGVTLADNLVADRLAFIDSLPGEMTASMAQDLARGNRLELDWLAGAVARMGRELGVDTPVNGFIYAALKLSAAGRLP